MRFYKDMKQFYSVLTNGETELEIYGSRYSCGINPEGHLYSEDGYGNRFIDGKPARIEIRIKE